MPETILNRQARPLTSNGRPNAQAIDEYTKAIKKCGKIISTDKKGKRVEEAYYLMQNPFITKEIVLFRQKTSFKTSLFVFPIVNMFLKHIFILLKF